MSIPLQKPPSSSGRRGGNLPPACFALLGLAAVRQASPTGAYLEGFPGRDATGEAERRAHAHARKSEARLRTVSWRPSTFCFVVSAHRVETRRRPRFTRLQQCSPACAAAPVALQFPPIAVGKQRRGRSSSNNSCGGSSSVVVAVVAVVSAAVAAVAAAAAAAAARSLRPRAKEEAKGKQQHNHNRVTRTRGSPDL